MATISVTVMLTDTLGNVLVDSLGNAIVRVVNTFAPSVSRLSGSDAPPQLTAVKAPIVLQGNVGD